MLRDLSQDPTNRHEHVCTAKTLSTLLATQPGMSRRVRQEAMRAYNILETPAESVVQDLVAVAALAYGAPMGRLAFVDWDTRQVLIKASVGLDATTTVVSFDDNAIQQMLCMECIRRSDSMEGGTAGAPLVVSDLDNCPQFQRDPLVRQHNAKFYYAVPLTTPSGIPIGVLSVMDIKPRTFPQEEMRMLVLLSRQVMGHYEYQRENCILKNTLAEREALRLRLRQVLGGMLPAHVIASIKRGLKPPPDHFDPVTVFFSDIVGFTDICAAVSPTSVVHMLDTLYSAMDRLVIKHKLFKVETIGDVFVCSGGMLEPQADHTLRIARFAVEAVQAASKVPIDRNDLSKGFVSIRVGFHTGPVVANVVGRSRPRYCLFGDTVNTAARMQTASHAERINMSPAAAEALRSQCPHVRVEERPPMFIKGKGEMTMFFLDTASVLPKEDELSPPRRSNCPPWLSSRLGSLFSSDAGVIGEQGSVLTA
ncbi:hypothetical protein LEN26_005967 [Aphanomyces euteiches]|nr:hypothetical protein LEN26_005967 [Aphanomyces euteiches]